MINLIKSFINPPAWVQKIPPEYCYLVREKMSRTMVEALKLYGTLETKGDGSNPVILQWAKEIGGFIEGYYKDDSIPWCGLAMAISAKRAGYPHTQNALSALSFLTWGEPVAMAGVSDMLIFKRDLGGHVGQYAGEDNTHYHVYGGNQSDAMCFARIDKKRLVGIRRQKGFSGGRKVFIAAKGAISYNEA
jgi:uncharacterized protein (TIGR02594 family)